MGCYFTGDERIRPPEEYVEHLTRIGGINRFGDPNFILVWGQTRTWKIFGTDARGRKGQHTVLQFGGVPAWHLMAWKPPETWGTPELWYALTWDPESKTHGLGDFPWRGDYAPCRFNLYVRRMIGGGLHFDPAGNVVNKPAKLEIDAMPLAHWVLDLIVPNVIKDQETTYAQRCEAVRKRMEVEKAKAAQQAFDAYRDASPAFGGADFSKSSNREAWMQRIKEKQAGMKISAEEIKKRMGSGHRTF
jgi:hypothetical protein